MSDASGSGERPKVTKPAILSSQSAMSIGLVLTLLSVMFYAGQQTGRARTLEEDNDAKFKAIQQQVANEISVAAKETNLKIDSLKVSMEIRAANRDKEIDTINKRLDGHDLTLHELFLSINKMLDRKP